MILQKTELPEQIEIHLIQNNNTSHPFGVRYFDADSDNTINGITFFTTLKQAQKKFDAEVKRSQAHV